MDPRKILADNKIDLALVIGNGINRYGAASQANSWDALLLDLASKHGIEVGSKIPDGITLTEFYDLLELDSAASATSKRSLQEEFCTEMDNWRVFAHHQRIVAWARKNATPILTTNFDTVLSRAGDCRLLPDKLTSSFTDFYPWNRYYGDSQPSSSTQGFGIWHVNGMQKYRRSVRLGLTHYMGSVERVRGWMHKSRAGRLFTDKEADTWPGASTWLHFIFNKPLFIFGLGLDENEIFLRWLLIERARFFKKFPERHRNAWYVYSSENEKKGKLFFLEKLGIKPVKADTYEKIYGESTWN